MPHGEAGKADARRLTRPANTKRWLAGVLAIFALADQGRECGDFPQQAAQFNGFFAVIEGCDQFDRLLQAFKIAFELIFDVVF